MRIKINTDTARNETQETIKNTAAITAAALYAQYVRDQANGPKLSRDRFFACNAHRIISGNFGELSYSVY